MTVAELIEKLKEMNPALPVYTRENYFGYPDHEINCVDLSRFRNSKDPVVLID